jgi:uncharacterized protein
VIFVDTGFFIALLNPGDNLHARAQAWAAAMDEPLLTTEYVIVETVNWFSAPIDRPKAHALVAHLRSEPGYTTVPASPDLFDSGLILHARRPDKAWSLTDCISFVTMEEHKVIRTLAYDHHFEQAGFEALLRREPNLTP